MIAAGQALSHALRKRPSQGALANMADDERACAEFSRAAARRDLEGSPGRGLNIAYEAADRHASVLSAAGVALRFLPRRGEVRYAG